MNKDNLEIFYSAISSPPGIMEVDTSMQRNFRVRKVYFASDEDSMVIGKPYITTNYNYIVHVIENIITG